MIKKLTTILMSLTITLATFSAQAWTIQDDYDSLPLGGNCGILSSTPLSVVSNTEAYTGTQSCEHGIVIGQTDWGGIITFPSNLVKGDEIWIRVHTFMPLGFDYNSYGEGELLKFLRVHTRTVADSNIGYNDWYITPTNNTFASHQFIYEGEQEWAFVTDMSLRPVLNQWETYEFYLKLDDVPVDSGGQARARFWKNGVLILDTTNRQTLQTAATYADRMHIFTYWNGNAPQTQQMYIDDLVITTTTPANTDPFGNPFIGDDPNTPPTSPVLVAPADDAVAVDPNTVIFEWLPSTDINGDSLTYQVTVCTDNTFAGCTPMTVATLSSPLLFAGVGGVGVLLLGFVGVSRTRRWQWVAVIIAIGLITSCSNSETTDDPESAGCTAGAQCFTNVTTLTPATTYYWKVTANDGAASTDSAVWSFDTQ